MRATSAAIGIAARSSGTDGGERAPVPAERGPNRVAEVDGVHVESDYLNRGSGSGGRGPGFGIRGSGFARDLDSIDALSEPRAPSPEPRAPSPEPRAPSPEPRAPSPEPQPRAPLLSLRQYILLVLLHLSEPGAPDGHVLGFAVVIPHRAERQRLRFFQQREARGVVAGGFGRAQRRRAVRAARGAALGACCACR